MPFKVGKLYANMATDNGVVKELTDKLITVQYEDKTIKSYPLNKQYGRMEGTVYPHNLVTYLKKGDKFKKDDPITWNTAFFEQDWLNPKRIVMKFNAPITVAITMNNEVYEDSSAVSQRIGKLMATDVIKEKVFRFETTKHIINLLPVGTKVSPTDVLFSMLDPNTDYTNLSESSIKLLSSMGALSPKAKYNGVIDRYEIKYNGEKSDMSPSVRKLANQLDKELAEETKNTEYYATDNRVSSEYRSEGKNLNIDTCELRVFIRVQLEQSVGDKGVFGNQMKSVISEVYSKNIVTDSGETVDGMFGYIGVLNRMVNSMIVMGATQRITKHVSKQIADVYFGK